MSLRLIRVLACDVPDCETPLYPVQGEDDQAIKDGWKVVEGTPPRHLCPKCAADNRLLTPVA